jgi:uridine phosphorylase
MESATLFTMCSANGWRAGCVSGVLVNRTDQEAPDEEKIEKVEYGAIATAVGAAGLLLRGAS